MAICLQAIARKTATENTWLSWIPIGNLFLMCNIAKKPTWYILLFIVPLVNIYIFIVIWGEIAKACNKPWWLGVLWLIPLINCILPGYLAFSRGSQSTTVNFPLNEDKEK